MDNNGKQSNSQSMCDSDLQSITSLLIIKTLSEKFPELGETVLDTPINQLDATLNFTLVDRYLLYDLLILLKNCTQSKFIYH